MKNLRTSTSELGKVFPSKHKDAITTLSQRWKMVGSIDLVSSLEMRVLPTSVDNGVVTWKHNTNRDNI